jgi:5-formyltetrahydrofolate cyclo-ligase
MIQTQSKSDIRKKFLDKRLQLSFTQRFTLSKKIHSNLIKESSYRKSKNIGIFMPIQNEPILFFDHRKINFVPVIKSNHLQYCFLGNLLKRKSYNILEPIKRENAQVKKLNLLIVPFIAFNADLHRVGYGKGYFDHLLSIIVRQRYRPRIWGIGYQFQLCQDSFQDKSDIRLDKIITDQKIYG